MIYKIGLVSTTDYEQKYLIIVDTEKQTVNCDCKAGRILGRCKHIRFYKGLIRDLLHENPCVEREKGGK